ncbi:pentatricopeptide repeat-containing protein At1g80150, mitochondrial [Andrographis paniculata]|uniref:pentatricopeptide repeat-containing protein At1g80150, mitochondrial n=1 Tax=Andrographis paniculata TaxID=175694 RepID=UPI0021E87432|nr:pentatricopeptide repeat-containing protein At1g80150, mitochondrial [Andrographis paniculata]XP_051152801.1 pentatricopeptide repeat-containing protein At1g80150, mitochondrial [Andrographis paniculata]XP_051152809.1 pentatricopeptide repeat-containing protein At1g80150, mitochondrial [Andrographis paniculata]XP_051152816.1 pentatricopeptide repeat-containing protein At1g80150, mitochondrial [Andrographis paniculata]XP_051152823.1 pentatricopeptide repeat-containing protein At1g80150, mitoc
MLSSLRLVRRFGTVPNIAPISISSSSSLSVEKEKASSVTKCPRNPRIELEEPALVKLKKERDPEKLFNLFKANASNKIVVENRFAFEDTVSRLAGAGRFDYIETLLEHQKSLPQGKREGFMVRIIMLYGMAGMTKQALDTFCDMHLYGCKRTVKSFNAALKVLAQSRDLEALESFLGDFPFRYNIEIDVYSINIVVKAFCEMGVLDKAGLVLVEMEKWRVTPDVITYTTLISAFYKVNRPEIANGLWNLMVLKGCFPNVATFNARIQFLVSKGRAWEANKLLGFMRSHKKLALCPDEVTYNLVIKGFCRAQFLEMAMRVYSAFQGEGYKPNQKIYQTMVHYLCKEGKYDMAYAMCKDSMQKNLFPSVETIYSLLEGLQKDGGINKIQKANFLYSLALRRQPPFSAAELETMKAILSRK